MFHGKMKAVTFSYDDGVTQDRRLIGILNRYGLRGTFNLNSGQFASAAAFYDEGKNITFPHVRLRASEIAEVYAGHEVASHTVLHKNLTKLSDEAIIAEVENDRKALSALVGYEVRGFAYPYGTGAADARAAAVLRTRTGVRYARTTTSTHRFDLPDDPMFWHPTVRHAEWDVIERLTERFLSMQPDTPQLFYIWGHAYEFDRDGDWERFEAFCEKIAGRDDIFYGTNAQVLLGK